MRHTEKFAGLNSTVFISWFFVSVGLAFLIAMLSFGLNLAGFSLFLFPLLCSLPVLTGLFAVLNRKLKKNSILGTLLPLLVFPLLFSLLFAYMMFYERNPQHMFKVFVLDPIPVEVTDIQARYIDEGFYEDVLISFQAPPDVVAMIFTQKDLRKVNGKFNSPDQDLPEASWGNNWVLYDQTLYKQSGAVTGYIKMWVELERSIVLYRRVVE